jgi:hypothetical protein
MVVHLSGLVIHYLWLAAGGSRLRRLAIEATKRCAQILEHAGKIAGQGGTMAD